MRSGPGKTGYEKRKKAYSTKNVESTLVEDMLVSHIFSVLTQYNTPLKHENQRRVCDLSLVFFKPIILSEAQALPSGLEAEPEATISLRAGGHYSNCERSELT